MISHIKNNILIVMAIILMAFLSWYQGIEIDECIKEMKRIKDIHHEARLGEFCYIQQGDKFCLRYLKDN